MASHPMLDNRTKVVEDFDTFRDKHLQEPDLNDLSKYIESEHFSTFTNSLTYKHKLTILNTNGRSLPKHIEQYKLLLNSLNDESKQNVDVITFEETWLNPELESLVQIEGYKLICKL